MKLKGMRIEIDPDSTYVPESAQQSEYGKAIALELMRRMPHNWNQGKHRNGRV